MIEITEEMVDAYMDGFDDAKREKGPDPMRQFRGWVRDGLAAVAPLMVAAEREACAEIADDVSDIWRAVSEESNTRGKSAVATFVCNEIAPISAAIRARGDRP